jgi:hypothetical protein
MLWPLARELRHSARVRAKLEKRGQHCKAGGTVWAEARAPFTVWGVKRVEYIPQPWVDAVRQRVDQDRLLKQAVTELFLLNAELLILDRKQQPRKHSQKRTAK